MFCVKLAIEVYHERSTRLSTWPISLQGALLPLMASVGQYDEISDRFRAVLIRQLQAQSDASLLSQMLVGQAVMATIAFVHGRSGRPPTSCYRLY